MGAEARWDGQRGGRAPLSSRQVAAFAILVLMSMVLSFLEVPLLPGVDWLKYDPSGAVAALTALLFGPWQGVAVAFLSWIPHLVTGTVGAAMNIMASASLAVVLGSVFRAHRTLRRAVLGGIGGVIAATAVSICLNFVATPVYLGATYQEVAALVVPALLPFNLAKALANAALGLVAYRHVHALLEEGFPVAHGDGEGVSNGEAGEQRGTSGARR